MRIASLLVLLLILATFAGCSGNDDSTDNSKIKDNEIFDLNMRLNESVATKEILEQRLIELEELVNLTPALETNISELNKEIILLNTNITNLENHIQLLNEQYSQSISEVNSLTEQLTLSLIHI